MRAKIAIQKGPVQSVPLWLRDAHSKAGKDAGHGRTYRYSHDFPEAVSGQEFMLEPMTFFEPGSSGAEEQIRDRLAKWKAIKKKFQDEEKG